MPKTNALLVAPLAMFVFLSPAAALDEMSASADGRGSISVHGQSLPVSRAEVSLITGGQFIVSVIGEQRYAFRGEWRQQGNNIALTIQKANDRTVGGSGEIRLRGDRFRTIRIDGENNAFTANFTAEGAYTDFTQSGAADDVQAPDPFATSAPVAADTAIAAAGPAPKVTVQGSGSVVRGRNDRKEIDAMEIFLEPDGRLHLKTFGPGGENVFAGTWRAGTSSGGQQRFELTISSAFGGRIGGRGALLVGSGGRIDQLSLQGSSRASGAYVLDFRQR